MVAAYKVREEKDRSLTNLHSDRPGAIASDLNEGNVEAVAALAYIAEVFEADPETAFAKTLAEWSEWLGDEGYTPASVEKVIRQVVATELDAPHQSTLLVSLSEDMSVLEAVQKINAQAPRLIGALLRHVEHGADLHAALLGVSGGTGRREAFEVGKSLSNPLMRKVQEHLNRELALNEPEKNDNDVVSSLLQYDERTLRSDRAEFTRESRKSNSGSKILEEEFGKATLEFFSDNNETGRNGGVEQYQRERRRETINFVEEEVARSLDKIIRAPEFKQAVDDEFTTLENERWIENQRQERKERVDQHIEDEISTERNARFYKRNSISDRQRFDDEFTTREQERYQKEQREEKRKKMEAVIDEEIALALVSLAKDPSLARSVADEFTTLENNRWYKEQRKERRQAIEQFASEIVEAPTVTN